MDLSLDIEPVSETLPTLAGALDDPRLRPVGFVGGLALLLVGALLSLLPATGDLAFWASAVASTLVFVGVPLFCLGLAAPEPQDESLFAFGIDLSKPQRRAVAAGALSVTLSPVVVALGSPLGIVVPTLVAAAVFSVVGAGLMLVGFVGWLSRVLADPSAS